MIAKLALGATLAAVAALAYARFVEPRRLTLTRAEIPLAGLSRPVKIAAIADIHAGFGGMDCARIAAIMGAICAQSPDMVVFLGDLFEKYRKYSRGRERELARALAPEGMENVPKLAVLGNHDADAQDAFFEIFTSAGWNVLKNASDEHFGLRFIGSDGMKYGTPDIGGLLCAGSPCVVLIHEPDYAGELRGVALQLSGHTHGGQVRLPLLPPLKLPVWGRKYVYGLHKKPDGGYIFVTRGLGMSNLPLRFLAPPELVIITLTPVPQNGVME